jgi:hypothetical protein
VKQKSETIDDNNYVIREEEHNCYLTEAWKC